MGKGFAGLKPPDAIHIATALFAKAAALHTFDIDLLKLNGKVDRPEGGKLEICKPAVPGKKGPLEELAQKGN